MKDKTNLKELDLSFNSSITIDIILKIGIALRKLRTLEIAHLPSFPKDCCTEDFEAALRFMKDNLNIRKISLRHFIGGGPKLKILCKILILIKNQGINFFKSCRVHKGGWASFITFDFIP